MLLCLVLIYFDFSGCQAYGSVPYFERLANIDRTNEMLRALRPIVASVPHKLRIDENQL